MRKVNALRVLAAAMALLPPLAQPLAKSQRYDAMARSAPDKDVQLDAKRALGAGISAFAVDLFAAFKKQERGNLFISPYSIAAALSMTNAGARGNTQAELTRALHLPQSGGHAEMGALIAELNASTRNGQPRGFRLAVANRLFGARGAKFLPDFLAVNASQYGAPLEQLDFMNALEPSRKTINQWVEQRTENRIQELIPAGQLTKDARLVLVNAIYFRSDWAMPFVKPFTKDAPFHIAADKKVTAQLMLRIGEFPYYEEAGKLQVAELPYTGDELSMLVLLPAEKVGLDAFESSLSVENIQKWTAALAPRSVKLQLPRFKLTWGVKNVIPQLSELGIHDAFVYRKADFSGMDGGNSLIISLVLHKAFVDVNEEGTEAAAATAVVTAPGGAPPAVQQPKEFKADRPFIFLIRHKPSGATLFIGRVTNPLGDQ